MPEPSAIVARARVGDALGDVDFYELGRFVDALDALARAWDGAGGEPAGRPPQVDGLRAALAPGRERAGFYLADTFEPGLPAARAALAQAEAEVDAGRTAVAARVRASLGVDPVGEEFVLLREVHAGPLPAELRLVRETPTYRVLAIGVVSAARDAALARVTEVEERARRELAERVAREAGAVAAATGALGALDRALARVAFAQRWGGCVPRFTGDRIAFEAATFAPLADALAARGHRYTPLDLDLRGVAVLTGPNMGGKSAALATAGFLCACAALGVAPPARGAALPLLDALVFIGGEGPAERARLLSSYAAEVVRARATLALASPRTLVLVDEFARTTGPREGRALLVAVRRGAARARRLRAGGDPLRRRGRSGRRAAPAHRRPARARLGRRRRRRSRRRAGRDQRRDGLPRRPGRQRRDDLRCARPGPPAGPRRRRRRARARTVRRPVAGRHLQPQRQRVGARVGAAGERAAPAVDGDRVRVAHRAVVGVDPHHPVAAPLEAGTTGSGRRDSTMTVSLPATSGRPGIVARP